MVGDKELDESIRVGFIRVGFILHGVTECDALILVRGCEDKCDDRE